MTAPAASLFVSSENSKHPPIFLNARDSTTVKLPGLRQRHRDYGCEVRIVIDHAERPINAPSTYALGSRVLGPSLSILARCAGALGWRYVDSVIDAAAISSEQRCSCSLSRQVAAIA